MRRPTARQRRGLALTLAVLAFSLAFYAGQRVDAPHRPQPAIRGVAIDPPRPLLPDTISDDRASPIAGEFRGAWSLLALSPRSGTLTPNLIRLQQVHNRLAADPDLQRRLRFRYLTRTNAPPDETPPADRTGTLRPLELSSREAESLLHHLGANESEGGETLYLIGPDLRLHALFTPTQDAATIAGDLQSLIVTEP